MSRIERLINLTAALLDTPRPLTAEEIREKVAGYDQPNFEAFRRSFERDKESLRAMGIPLEARTRDVWSETPDAYIIPKDRYYLPDPGLDPDEIAALRIAAEAALGGAEQATSGLLKLAVGAPPPDLSGPRIVWGAELAADHPHLGPLFAALLDRARVAFDYRPRDADQARRTVETYGLVLHGGSWYVVGRDVGRDDVRTFKVSRIASDVEQLEQTYDIPPDFDPSHHLRRGWEIGGDPVEDATVRFDLGMRWWVEQNLSRFPRAERPDGTVDITMRVADREAFVSWVLEFGDAAEIVAPEAAREAMRRRLRTVLEVPGP